eukprot:TRINITY_DN1427_c1_g3_i2.p1 TRINITY_DN1427_c1_g3~~TRINITY_DN1427_c1_g3_i2.p1  ORF type:complete len:986 (+),score=417.46 TRINITY_DN1427_c1_g3_i2:63-3020(+)
MHARTPRNAMSIVSERAPVSFAVAGVPREESAFLKDLEAMGECCSDVKNPWNERVDALKQLQALVIGGAGRFHTFKDAMHAHMRHQLIVQIGELRSVVVKEACIVVMALCKFTPPHVFDEMAGWFVAALQKQLPVTVQAISEAAQRAMRYIIEQGRVSHNFLRAILEAARQKNNKTRARTLEHIFLIFHHVPLDSFSNHDVDALVATLVRSFEDNDPIVRQFARLSYWGLEANAPVRAGELWSRLGEQQRRQITQERNSYLALDPALLTRNPDTAGDDYAAPISAPPPPAARQQTPKAGAARLRSRSGAAKGPTARSRTPGPLTETRSVNVDKPRACAPRTGIAAKKGPRDNSAGPGVRGTPRGTPAQAPQHPPAMLEDTGDVEMMPEAPAPAVHHAVQQAPPRGHQAGHGLPHGAPVGTPVSADVPMEPVAYPSYPVAAAQPDERQVIEELLHVTSKHSDWEIRADSYSRIAGGVVKPEAGGVLGGKVLEACLARLQSEGHFKVVTEMLLCIQKVAEEYPKETLPLLERTLTTVFACMAEKKDCVKDKARAVVDGIMGVNTVGTMFQALLKVLDCTASKVRVACLECFLYILRFCQEYLGNGKHMRQALGKLLKVLKTPAEGDVRQVEKMCTNCLQMLFRVQPNVFAAEATGLQVQQKKDLLLQVQGVIPQLRDMMHSARARHEPPPPQQQQQQQHQAMPPPPPQQQPPQPPQQVHRQQHADPMAHVEQQQHHMAAIAPPTQQQQQQQHQHPSGADVIMQLGQGSSSEMKQRALQELMRFNVRQREWTARFHELMPEVLACFKDPVYYTRCLAVATVQMALEQMPTSCVDVLPDVLLALHRAIDDEQPEVNSRARDAIFKVTLLPPHVVLPTLVAHIAQVSDRALQVLLANVFPPVIAGAMPLDVSAIKPVTDLVLTSIQSDLTDLRKAATWCLVDLYLLTMGRPIVIQICRELSPAKIWLLDFYIQKRGGQSDLATEMAAGGH